MRDTRMAACTTAASSQTFHMTRQTRARTYHLAALRAGRKSCSHASLFYRSHAHGVPGVGCGQTEVNVLHVPAALYTTNPGLDERPAVRVNGG